MWSRIEKHKELELWTPVREPPKQPTGKGMSGGNEEETTDMSLNNIKSPIFDLLTYQNTQKRDPGCKNQRNYVAADLKKKKKVKDD